MKEEFSIFSEPEKCWESMLEDIKNAKNQIYLETYIYDNDLIGIRFRNLLIEKVKEGVKVKVLIDAWGSKADKNFFQELINSGGEVRFFREFKYVLRFFSKNHERNHRKLLLIDGKISYIGSLNIADRFVNWRELMIRFVGEITEDFEKSFFQIWKIHGKFTKRRFDQLVHRGFQILQDNPSDLYRPVQKRFKTLIKYSQKSILIENPFLLLPRKVRKELIRAVKRGVKVVLVLPRSSDVKTFDLVRDRYLGELHKGGIKIWYYDNGKPYSNLHAKLLIVDDKVFVMGSSNLDYRSFIYQYEINVIGRNRKIISELKHHFKGTLEKSKPFNYSQWKTRSSFNKLFGIFLSYFREYL